MKATYEYVYTNCTVLYDRELSSNQEPEADAEVHFGPKHLDFWPKLISLLVSVTEEDRTIYSQVLNQ